jgi:hypothetical protein
MKASLLRGVVALALGCAAGGCSYVPNRLADMADVFTVELTAGPGVGAQAQVTGLVGTAVGSSKQSGIMLHGRYAGIATRDTGGAVVTGSTSISGDALTCPWGGKPYTPRSRSWLGFMRWPPFAPALKGTEWPRLLDVEMGASAGVGCHLGFSGVELLDFVVGLTSLDICEDDHYVDIPREIRETAMKEAMRRLPLLLE